jgi:two-component system cell cycle sensor histidine kinase/response regulator CckA
VTLVVSDTGIGMDQRTRARVFEPFFTTKPPGLGTGLGLSTVYAIVRRHGGFIQLGSTPGRGTTFEIFLPRVAPCSAEAGDTARAELPRGRETVLLVEDAAAVRMSMCEVLARLGYAVLEAPDGEAALSIASKHHGDIDLLVTDLVMPRMGGKRLVERLLAVRPQLRSLVISGYDEDEVTRRGLAPGTSYLQKPFSMEQLSGRVREALDRA